ncbi:MAG: exodeoxyribonuclease VII small subunit [Lachnospiraceae bacterium]|nr:exodeoxyribonuclease VII small subunit [Lachnospiraceae bacterium]
MAQTKLKEKTEEKSINVCFEELEQLIEEMEDPSQSLEESFEKYKKGVTLIKECSEKIERVEKELRIIEESDNKHEEQA